MKEGDIISVEKCINLVIIVIFLTFVFRTQIGNLVIWLLNIVPK